MLIIIIVCDVSVNGSVFLEGERVVCRSGEGWLVLLNNRLSIQWMIGAKMPFIPQQVVMCTYHSCIDRERAGWLAGPLGCCCCKSIGWGGSAPPGLLSPGNPDTHPTKMPTHTADLRFARFFSLQITTLLSVYTSSFRNRKTHCFLLVIFY